MPPAGQAGNGRQNTVTNPITGPQQFLRLNRMLGSFVENKRETSDARQFSTTVSDKEGQKVLLQQVLLILGPRVRLIVSLFQPFSGKMSIHLRRHQMGVSEQFLHAAQVGAD